MNECSGTKFMFSYIEDHWSFMNFGDGGCPTLAELPQKMQTTCVLLLLRLGGQQHITVVAPASSMPPPGEGVTTPSDWHLQNIGHNFEATMIATATNFGGSHQLLSRWQAQWKRKHLPARANVPGSPKGWKTVVFRALGAGSMCAHLTAFFWKSIPQYVQDLRRTTNTSIGARVKTWWILFFGLWSSIP